MSFWFLGASFLFYWFGFNYLGKFFASKRIKTKLDLAKYLFLYFVIKLFLVALGFAIVFFVVGLVYITEWLCGLSLAALLYPFSLYILLNRGSAT